MIACFIMPDDKRWLNALSRGMHDLYHLPEYVKFSARHEGGIPVAFYAEKNGVTLLVPLLIQDVPENLDAPDGWKDFLTPYGYPTPLLIGDGSDLLAGELFDAFLDTSKRLNIVSGFFRLHPLIPISDEVLAPYGDFESHGETVFIDLSLSVEEMWSQTRGNHRTTINKLKRGGFEVIIDDWSRYDEFIAVYNTTMERVSASDFYFFTEEYFNDLRATFADCLHLCCVIAPSGEIASAGLFTAANDMVQYHLGGTASKYLRQAPSKLIFDRIRYWAKDNGNRVLHLGGGLGGQNDSLFNFKAGFSKQRASFNTFRMIVDEDKYGFLCDRWREQSGQQLCDKGYFPPYKRPH